MKSATDGDDPRYFRVLVVDDIPESGQIQVELLNETLASEPIVPILVHGLDDAKAVLQERCVDFVLTDYNLGRRDPTGGLRLLEYLASVDANIDAGIYTRHFHESAFKDQIIQTLIALTRSKVHVRAAVNLGVSTEPLESALAAAHADWVKRRVAVDDEIDIGSLLCEARIARWSTPVEAQAEFLRIASAIYGNAGLDERPLEFQVKLAAGELYDVERGHSGAVVVSPEIRFESLATDNPPVRTVLKLGDPPAMQSERNKFRNLVAFGFPLKSRVEFLGYSRRHNIAGLCYGFAGGVFGDSVVSLRRDMERPGGAVRVQSAIRELFAEDNRCWYGHIFETKIAQTRYAVQTNRRPISKMIERVEKAASQLDVGAESLVQKRTVTERDGVVRLTVGSAKITLPSQTFAGSVLLTRRWRQTLVHGDLHLGNVLLELVEGARGFDKQRSVLIDFADAGPGPRSEDLATLYASAALEDAHRVERDLQEVEARREWIAEQRKGDRRRLEAAFGLKAVEDVLEAPIQPVGSWEFDVEDHENFDAIAGELLGALDENFPGLTFGEFSASLFVRSMELAIHERSEIGFLRLVSITGLIGELVPDGVNG